MNVLKSRKGLTEDIEESTMMTTDSDNSNNAQTKEQLAVRNKHATFVGAGKTRPHTDKLKVSVSL